MILKGTASTDQLLIENAVETEEFTTSHFLEAIFGVEMLRSYEDDGGVQVQ
jgi:hypothetical protein